MTRAITCAAVALVAGGTLLARPAQPSPFLPVADIRPGQVGIGRTVFAGETIEDFRATIIGVLRNVLGPKRDLILAKLDGGPLATTGVIQGMSGSPVYIDGRMIGAVSYALGSFPREAIAGITPIAEMIEDVDRPGPRTTSSTLALDWSTATPTSVYAALGRLMRMAGAFPSGANRDAGVFGPASLADLIPTLRPIGAAMVLSGFDPGVADELRRALPSAAISPQGTGAQRAAGATFALKPGAAVGMSLVHGDLEVGATGTVTWVDGNRVYAFGHPFLNLGPTSMPMTRSRVYGILPSLDSSMKLAGLGDVIGTMNQDRATAVAGVLGALPKELEVKVTLSSDRAPDRQFRFYVVHDQLLTPLFSYVAVINALGAYERQTGMLSITATGTSSFGADGTVRIDDAFSGESSVGAAANALTAPIAAAAANEFKTVVPDSLDVQLRVSEQPLGSTIERVWLDTMKPKAGATHNVQVLLKDYRGGTETVSMPITMPAHMTGPITLLVSDAATLTQMEQRDLRPVRPSTWAGMVTELNAARRNNRLYVRLIAGGSGTVVAGQPLPGLPASIRTVLDADGSVASSTMSRTVLGAWERRLDRVIRGSRELTLTLGSAQ